MTKKNIYFYLKARSYLRERYFAWRDAREYTPSTATSMLREYIGCCAMMKILFPKMDIEKSENCWRRQYDNNSDN